jgi:hypothetical protein
MYSSRAWLVFPTTVIFIASAGQAEAQSFTKPQSSVLWAVPSIPDLGASGAVPQRAASSKGRGLLIGAIIGGVAAGFFGNRMCHAYSATAADACVGDTLWWAAVGGMLGGLIGATGSGESDR